MKTIACNLEPSKQFLVELSNGRIEQKIAVRKEQVSGFKIPKAMAALVRRIWKLHPRAAMQIRTQAWPDGEQHTPPPKSRFKGRTVREINRYNEPSFDTTSINLQNLRLVHQIFHLLSSRPRGLMEMSELATHHAEAVLEHPAIFNVIQSRYLCLSGEAQKLYLQEEALNGEDDSSVRNLRKILMLAGKRRISVRKVELLAMDVGLPIDLDGFLGRYEKFFRVSRTLDLTPWVSLGEWDPELAVSLGEIEERRRKAGTMSQMEMWTPKGYELSKRHRKVLARFREAPFISPYADYRDLEPLKMEFEKHAVAGMQELLNLTTHKSLLLSILNEFKTEFSFSHKPLELLLRHPEYFYVSRAGNQETVFLRSAYRNGELARKTTVVSIREQLMKLLNDSNGRVRAIKET